MNFDPKYDYPEELLFSDEWVLHRLFSRFIFDVFVKVIVREYFGFIQASYVSLHIDRDNALLFVWDNGRVNVRDDIILLNWVLDFIGGELLEVDLEDVDLIYLSGAVDEGDPFLHIEGSNVLIATGSVIPKGRYLS